MKKIETISYKGYEIEIISEKTAFVVCKECKGQYIPHFDEVGCRFCIDDLVSGNSKERDHFLWDEKMREETIKEETL